MAVTFTPIKGSIEERWFFLGAEHEHDLTVEGMTEDNRQVYDCVQILAQKGDSVERIVRFVALVFTADWSLWRRIKLAWKIVRN